MLSRVCVLIPLLCASPAWAQVSVPPDDAVARMTVDGRPLIQGRQSLARLIDFALAHNPELVAATFDGQAANARVQGAEGAHLPRLSIEGGYTRYGDDLRLSAARYNGEPGVFGDNIFNADLVIRLPLYAGGRLVAEVRAAELLATSAMHRLARTRGELVYNLSSLYFGLLAQDRLVESLNFSTEALSGQLDRIEALIAARKAAKVDALRTEVKLADLRQRLLRETNSRAVLRQTLLNLLGAQAAPDFALAGPLDPPAGEERPIDALLASALARRPDALAARAELAAQGERMEAARAGYRPAVNLVGAVGNRVMRHPTQLPAGLQTNDDAARIGITFEMPLFDGGRTGARVDEENAKYAAQQERLYKLQLQVRLEIETAHANLGSALERLASTGKTIEMAQESLRIEQEKYALGRGTAQDVLDAQAALLDAQTSQIRALADANIATAQLALVTGEELP